MARPKKLPQMNGSRGKSSAPLSDKDKKALDKTYRKLCKLLGYNDENNKPPSFLINKIVSFVALQAKNNSLYTYENLDFTIDCVHDIIERSLKYTKFENEQHKISYVFKIITNNMNTVKERLQINKMQDSLYQSELEELRKRLAEAHERGIY